MGQEINLQLVGTLIFKGDTQQVSERFKKREFVVEISEEVNGNVYTNYGKFQLVQNKCEVLDRYTESDVIRIHFNIKGNRWEKDGKVNYITNLDAWKIEDAPQNYQPAGSTDAHMEAERNRKALAAFNAMSPSEQQALLSKASGGAQGSHAPSSGYAGYNPASECVDDLPF